MNVRIARLFAFTALAASSAALSITAVVALNAGGSARLGPLPLMSLSAGYARPAERLLEGQPSRADALRAAALSREALARFPYDISSWLRLAYADSIVNGRLTADGVGHLQRSYDLAGVDIYAGVWRIGFILENSQSIPRELRQAARKEFQALYLSGKHRAELRQMARGIRNPAGRLSAQLWLRTAQLNATE